MKKKHLSVLRHLRTPRKTWHSVGAFGGLFLLLAVAFTFGIGPVRAVVQMQLDGGGGGDYPDTPKSSLPSDTTTNTSLGSSVDVATEYTNSNGTAAGRSVWTQQISDTFWYAWNRGTIPSSDTTTKGWATALSDPNVSIGYDYSIYDYNNPTTVIAPGATVTSGQKVILKFSPYVSDNIFWFGTGSSMDSPYGDWSSGAAAPARVGNNVVCKDKDLVQQYTYDNTYQFDVYIPLEVAPPTRSLTVPAGMSCGSLTTNADGSLSATCTITATSGTVTPKFNYTSTTGKFYYRYYDYRDMTGIGWGPAGCYGNNIPLTASSITGWGTPSGPTAQSSTAIYSPYVLNVPAESYSYPLTVGPAGNTPPGAPTVTCNPSSVAVNTDVSVKLTATDPDGDTVSYAVDWSGDGAQDSGWTSPFVSSGTSKSITKTGGWPTPGTYTVKGFAKDSNGNQSTGSTCKFTVTSGTGVDLTEGSVSLNDNTPTEGESLTLKSSATNYGAATSGSFPVLFQVQDSSTGTNVDLIDSSYLAALASGSSAQASIPYTFESAGTYKIRACANENTSWQPITTETDYTNNCGSWKSVTVTSGAGGGFSCTVDTASVPVGGQVTYTANGGNASDDYLWNAADNWKGTMGITSPTISRTFDATGSYGMAVTDRTGVNKTANCPVVSVGNACTNPTGTLVAAPNRVRAGDSAVLTWSASGISTSCVISGPGVNKTVPANSCTVGQDSLNTPPITAQSQYILTCDGNDVAQTIVNIIPQFQEF